MQCQRSHTVSKVSCSVKGLLQCQRSHTVSKVLCNAEGLMQCQRSHAVSKVSCSVKCLMKCQSSHAVSKVSCSVKGLMKCQRSHAVSKVSCIAPSAGKELTNWLFFCLVVVICVCHTRLLLSIYHIILYVSRCSFCFQIWDVSLHPRHQRVL